MRPGRELDTMIAQQVLGHTVKVKQKELWEETELGDRPLRKFSSDMNAAREIMEKLNITLIPVEGDQWFALAGGEKRWSSPADFLKFLQSGQFVDSGAAVGSNVPKTVCLAAMKAVQVRANLPLSTI